jgi:hypothetical protein
MTRLAAAFALALAFPASAQHPLTHPVDAVEIRFARSQPVVSYRLRVDAADLSGFDVEMRVRNAPDTFRVAMAAHCRGSGAAGSYARSPDTPVSACRRRAQR